MEKRERELVKQLRREESQLSKIKTLSKRNSQIFGSGSGSQAEIDPVILNARARS